MKTKVLTYKNGGDGLKQINIDLTKICDKVYYFETPDTYGTLYNIVFEYKDVFFCVSSIYDKNRTLSITEHMYNDWICNNLSDAAVLNPEKYTRNLEIEVLRLSGKAGEFLQKVIENKNAYLERKAKEEEQRRQERLKAEAEEKRIKNLNFQNEIKEAEKAYINGECIKPEMFAELCKNAGIILRPNTKGRLFNERKTARVSKVAIYERQRLPYFAGFFEAANQLNKYYNI